MRAVSRPLAWPKGVTPQSGIDSTSTRSARPPASWIVRSSRPANSPRYSSTGRPRYWLFTPISRLAKSHWPSGSAASMAADSSSVVQPVVAMKRGAASGTPRSRSAAASCTGHRPSSGTDSPMV